MATKMKKSNVKKKSSRAIERQQMLEAQAAAKEQRKLDIKKKKREMAETSIDNLLGMWSLGFAVIAWLIDWMGIFALISVIIGIVGINHFKDIKDKYFYLCIAGTALGAIRLATEYIPWIMNMLS